MVYLKKNLPVKLWVGFLLFASVYAFYLPVVGNASYWSFLLILMSLFLVNGALTNLLFLSKQKFFYFPIIVITTGAIFSFLIPVFYQTYDISMLKTWVNNLVGYFSMTVLACLFCTFSREYKGVFSLLFKILIIQAIIVWLMLASPSLREFIQSISKNAASTIDMARYGGVRGLGFTSFLAFGFSVIMGLLGLFLQFYFAEFTKNKSLLLKIMAFFIALIAAISAGRASIAGFAIGFIFYFFTLGFRRYLTGSVRVAFYCILLISPVVLYILSEPLLAEAVDKYYRYAFQFIYKYFTEGQVDVSSLSHLETMYFPLTEQQLLLGDGRYTGADGAYYLHTDPGFMRFTLIFGLFPSIILYLGFIWIMSAYYFINRIPFKNFGVLVAGVVCLSFVYHYKGELILYNVSYMKLVYFTFTCCSLITLKNRKEAMVQKGLMA